MSHLESKVLRTVGNSRRLHVVVLYKSLPQYRVAFFDELRLRLDSENIELALIHGSPVGDEETKGDASSLPWAEGAANRLIRVPRMPALYWQPCLRRVAKANLVIVEQASKLLINYVLLMKQRLGGCPVAFWGHGKNFQSHCGSRAGEVIKRRSSTLAHWWFAYNQLSADTVAALGYPRRRITVVNNSIDTRTISRARAGLSEAVGREMRESIGLRTSNVGLYCGAIYREKRLPFLIEAAHHIRMVIPDFELLVLGAGPEDQEARRAAADAPWIHYIGAKFGEDRIPYFLSSKVMLLPGLVGLAIVDSFALQVPLVTTSVTYHSPEINYLIDGENGVLLPGETTPKDYASAVVSILQDEDQLAVLRKGCETAASIYTLEAMVERFAQGVVGALAAS